MAGARRTLHEAMRIVLSEQPDGTATTGLVSDEIVRRGLYRQKGGGVAHKGQIRIRALKYPKLFQVLEREKVRLIDPDGSSGPKEINA